MKDDPKAKGLTAPADRKTGDKAPTGEQQAPPRKRRRWKRWVVLTLVLLLVLVGSLPSLISTGAGVGRIVSMANGMFVGQVGMAGLNLSWFGSCEVGEITVRDPQGREVLKVGGVAWSRGLWDVLTSWKDLGEITVQAPKATLYVDEHGNISLVEALSLREPTPPKDEPVTLPDITARLALVEGAVSMISHEGEAFDVSRIDGEVTLNTPNDITGSLKALMGDGGSIQATAAVQQLAPGGVLDPGNATGTVELTTGSDVDLGRLAEVFMPGVDAAGMLGMNVSVGMKEGRLDIDAKTGLTGLKVIHAGMEGAEPLDVTLESIVHAGPESIEATIALKTEAGTADLRLAFSSTGGMTALLPDDIVSALLAGESIRLPDGSLEVNSRLDLPKLAAAVPALLRIRPGLQVAGGELAVEKLMLTGGDGSSLTGSVKLTGLSARDEGREIIVDPASLDVDVLLHGEQGVEVRRLSLESGFAQVTAKGTIADFEATLRGDLSNMQQQLGQILDLGPRQVSGELAGSLRVQRVSDERSDVTLALTGKAVAYQQADTRLEIGELTMEASALRTSADAAIGSSGRLILSHANVDGKPVADGDVTLEWAGVEVGPAEGDIGVATATLASDFASLAINDIRAQLGDDFQVAGQVAASADVARALTVAASITGWEETPQIRGKLSLNSQCRSERGIVGLTGDLRIDGFEVGTGDAVVREERIDLTYDTHLTPKAGDIELAKLKLVSQLLSLDASGKVSDYRESATLDLAGDYAGSWDSITALLHELAPATAELVKMTGRTASAFTVTGPARQPEVTPVYHGVATGLDVGWASGNVVGVGLGEARISPTLKDGVLQVPLTEVPASGGTVRLGGTVDLRAPTPFFRLPGEVHVLENVPITPDTGKYLLSRINPLFAHTTRLEGTVSLMLQDMALPLGEEIMQGGRGKGHLDLSDVRIQPAGPLGDLFAFVGAATDDVMSMKVTGVDFELGNGRVSYDNFTIILLGDIDLRFYGSVGFDDSLDLTVSVPIRPPLLTKLGVVGPVVKYAEALAGSRLELPLKGTRMAPNLELVGIDVASLIEQAGKKLVADPLKKVVADPLKKVGEVLIPSDRTPRGSEGPEAGAQPESAPVGQGEEKKVDPLGKIGDLLKPSEEKDATPRGSGAQGAGTPHGSGGSEGDTATPAPEEPKPEQPAKPETGEPEKQPSDKEPSTEEDKKDPVGEAIGGLLKGLDKKEEKPQDE